MSFKDEYAGRIERAEGIIKRYLPKEEGYQKILFSAMNYSVNAKAKRLRPILLLECYEMFSDAAGDVAEPFAAAIEMIHTYSLVHDDLPAMDDDDLRRGRATTHIRYGEAMAILAGDGLLNHSMETALKAFDAKGADAKKCIRALGILYEKAGVCGMIGGQALDVLAEKNARSVDWDELHFIYENKTAALIEATMMIGALLSDNATENDIEAMRLAASRIGLAFQIQDDILDIEGDEEEIGKPVGSDIKNEKSTYITFAGKEAAKEKVRTLSDEAMEIIANYSSEDDFLYQLVDSLVGRRS